MIYERKTSQIFMIRVVPRTILIFHFATKVNVGNLFFLHKTENIDDHSFLFDNSFRLLLFFPCYIVIHLFSYCASLSKYFVWVIHLWLYHHWLIPFSVIESLYDSERCFKNRHFKLTILLDLSAVISTPIHGTFETLTTWRNVIQISKIRMVSR